MNNHYCEILYTLADGKRICLEVSIEVKELLEQSDRQIRSQRRQDRRRHTEYVESLIDTTTVLTQEDLADLVDRMDSYRRLHAAIGKLSETQRRRLALCFFGDFTYRQIAALENVSFCAVSLSIKQALEKLRMLIS